MSIGDQLRGGRVVASTGRLSLDRDQARRKLQLFRLPDPHYYVLQFVRAAHVLGATKIVFEVTAAEMRCEFDRVVRGELLGDIWAVAFDERVDASTEAVHYIALGLGSAQALKPSFIEIHSGDALLRVDRNEQRFGKAAHLPGTYIEVREKFRFGHLVEFFSTLGGDHPEVVALWSRCSHALIDVTVNGVRVSYDYSAKQAPSATVQGDAERGVILLDEGALEAQCWILRDGVHVATHRFEHHGVGAMGAIDSRRIRTDLSGLSLVSNDDVATVMRDVFVSEYHGLLARRLKTRDASVATKLDALAQLVRYNGGLTSAGFPPDKVSQELLDWLMREPLFEDATAVAGAPFIGFADTRSGDRFRVSQVRAPGVELPGGRVVWLPSSEGYGVNGLAELMLRESVVRALDEAGVEFDNVTAWLKRKKQTAFNRELWLARPATTFPASKFQHSVAFDGVVAQVSLPDSKECGLFIYVGSKWIHSSAHTEAFAVHIDGDFTPADTYDDIIRDSRFDRVAVQLCAAMLELYSSYARELLATNTLQPRPNILDVFVRDLCHGSFVPAFFSALGYADEARSAELQQSPELDVLWSMHGSLSSVLRWLGPIADVGTYELADGARLSLRDVASADGLMILGSEGEWGSIVNKARDVVGDEIPSKIVVVDTVQAEVLGMLFPDFANAAAIPMLIAKYEFMAKPPFDVVSRAATVEASKTVSHPLGEISMYLVPDGPRDTCLVDLVYQRRHIAQRHLGGGPASLHVVIESNRLTPNQEYTDVLRDGVYEALLAGARRAASEMVEAWWHERAARQDFGEGAVGRDFVSVGLALAKAAPDSPLVPVLRFDDETSAWRRDLESVTTLRREAVKTGTLLSYTRSGTLDSYAATSGVVLRLAADTPLPALHELFGDDVRLLEADAQGPSDSVGAYGHFLQKPKSSGEVHGGALKWSGRIGDLTVETAIFADQNVGMGRQSNIVEVLFKGRRLEKIEVELPMGRFATVVRGRSLGADPSYKFTTSGRTEVLNAAHEAAAATIREACRVLRAVGSVTPELREVANELRRFLAHCRQREPEPPFDLRSLLESTPLYETRAGSWLSFRQLGSIVRDGELLFATVGDRDDVLDFADPGYLAIAESLGDAFKLTRCADPQSRSGIATTVRHADPLLAALIEILLAARGERRDLFDDNLAGAFQWDDSAHGLCSVDHTSVRIRPSHPLVVKVREREDQAARAFLASAVYSAINAYYQRITDHDELELQAQLVRGMRG